MIRWSFSPPLADVTAPPAWPLDRFFISFFNILFFFSCLCWALRFDLCVRCLVGLICVPDSPSSVVNKQLGSMTLDEQQGASSSPPPCHPLCLLLPHSSSSSLSLTALHSLIFIVFMLLFLSSVHFTFPSSVQAPVCVSADRQSASIWPSHCDLDWRIRLNTFTYL